MKVICTNRFISSQDRLGNPRLNNFIDRFLIELNTCSSLKDLSNISKVSGFDIYIKRISMDMRILFSIEGDSAIILDLMKHR